jgi:hypothetical protein
MKEVCYAFSEIFLIIDQAAIVLMHLISTCSLLDPLVKINVFYRQ